MENHLSVVPWIPSSFPKFLSWVYKRSAALLCPKMHCFLIIYVIIQHFKESMITAEIDVVNKRNNYSNNIERLFCQIIIPYR